MIIPTKKSAIQHSFVILSKWFDFIFVENLYGIIYQMLKRLYELDAGEHYYAHVNVRSDNESLKHEVIDYMHDKKLNLLDIPIEVL